MAKKSKKPAMKPLYTQSYMKAGGKMPQAYAEARFKAAGMENMLEDYGYDPAKYGADIEPFVYHGYNDNSGNWKDPGLKKQWAAEAGMMANAGWVVPAAIGAGVLGTVGGMSMLSNRMEKRAQKAIPFLSGGAGGMGMGMKHGGNVPGYREMGGVNSMTPLPGRFYPDYDHDIRPLPGNWPTPNEDMKPLPGKAKSGIHIAPSKKGTFTAAASKHGMGVQAFARHVLANPGKFSGLMRKKANFARNAAKWKHEFGGMISPDEMEGGGKMPAAYARARFEAAGNEHLLGDYGYAEGGVGPLPPTATPSYGDYMNKTLGLTPVDPYAQYQNVSPYAPGKAPAESVAAAQATARAMGAAYAKGAADASTAPAVELKPYQGQSVYDFLTLQEKPGDYQSRKGLAQTLGIEGYRGSASQNLAMIDMVKQNPTVLLNYMEAETPGGPSISGGGGGRRSTMTAEDFVASPDIPLSSDTASTAAPKPNFPKVSKNEEAKTVSDVLNTIWTYAGLGIAGGALALNAREAQLMKKALNEGAFNLSPDMKAKVNEAITSLTKSNFDRAITKTEKFVTWYESLPTSTRNMLKELKINDIARIPGLETLKGKELKQVLAAYQFFEKKGLDVMKESEEVANLRMEKWFRNLPVEMQTLIKSYDISEIPADELKKAAQKMSPGKLKDVLETYSGILQESRAPAQALPSLMQRASQWAEQYPWMKTAGKALRRLPKFQDGGEVPASQWKDESADPNPWWVELLDPTGYTSWDDAVRAWRDPNAGYLTKVMETIGAVPVLGKVGKGAKALKETEKGAEAAAKALSKWQKTKRFSKNAGSSLLDYASGNPFVYFPEWAASKGLQQFPIIKEAADWRKAKLLANPKTAKTINALNTMGRSERFYSNAPEGVLSMTRGAAQKPSKSEATQQQEVEGEPIRLVTPDGRVIETNTGAPDFQLWYSNGAVDTTSFDPVRKGWKLKPNTPFKYQGGGMVGGYPNDPFTFQNTSANPYMWGTQQTPSEVLAGAQQSFKGLGDADGYNPYTYKVDPLQRANAPQAPTNVVGPDKKRWDKGSDVVYGLLGAASMVNAIWPGKLPDRKYQRPEDTPYQNQGVKGWGSSAIGNSPVGFSGGYSEAGAWIDGSNAVEFPYNSGVKFKAGGKLIKRKDGSYSRRGLWDNIRANRGSGKKPTAEMLRQERKIKAKEAEAGMGVTGMYYPRGGEISNVGSPKNPIARSGYNIRRNQDSEYEQGGELELYDGDVKDVSKNVLTGPSARFIGDSHAEGGMDMKINDKKINAEGGEGFWMDEQGNGHIFGAIKRPSTGKTFAQDFKELAKEEAKSFKRLQKAEENLGKYSIDDPHEKLKWNTAYLQYQGAIQEQAEQAAAKQMLAEEQQQMHDMAESLGIEPMELNKFKGKLPMAQFGVSIFNRQLPPSMLGVGNYSIGFGGMTPVGLNFNSSAAAADPIPANKKDKSNRGPAYIPPPPPSTPPPTTPPPSTPPPSTPPPTTPPGTPPSTPPTYYTPPPFKFIKDRFDYGNVAPEIYTLAQNRRIPVYAQGYTPELEQPYRLSPDISSEQAAFRAATMASGWNPSAISQAAAQKHAQVFAKEAATEAGNIQRYTDIVNRNKQTMNQAKVMNLGIYSQQQSDQRDLERYRRDVNREVLKSAVAKKLEFERLEKLRELYEKNLYNYRYDPRSTTVGYVGGPAPIYIPQAYPVANPAISETPVIPRINPSATSNASTQKPAGKKKAGGTIMRDFKRYNY